MLRMRVVIIGLVLSVFALVCALPVYSQTQDTYPNRPDIPAGGSNWVPSGNQLQNSNALGLVTTDLTSGMTPVDVVNSLVGGSGISISNIVYSGAPIALGTFTGGTGIIGFESGIILSSGNVASVAGPNAFDDVSTNNQFAGDPDLDALVPGYVSNDATVLEFDFTCQNVQVISFQYVFASDEYNEFVNSEFNDVFGFFVNGVNVALLPDMTTPVAINNLNCGNPYSPPVGPFCNLFSNNDLNDGGGSINTEMDGLTSVLVAQASVLPGTNHIKLAIADAGDWVLDSDIFLKAESFVCGLQDNPVYVDIKPMSCPNPFELRADGSLYLSEYDLNVNRVHTAAVSASDKSVLPVAVLGTADFDVLTIDPATVLLNGVAPIRWSIEDVAGPVRPDAEECECTMAGPDGYPDLTLKYNRAAIAPTLGSVTDGQYVTLELTGERTDGTAISGSDCILIRLKGTASLEGREEANPLALESHPNPFNAATMISYKLTEPGMVNLEIYNILGQHVATLVHEEQSTGGHSVSWNAGNMASGMYLYRLQVGAQSVTRKLTLLK